MWVLPPAVLHPEWGELGPGEHHLGSGGRDREAAYAAVALTGDLLASSKLWVQLQSSGSI